MSCLNRIKSCTNLIIKEKWHMYILNKKSNLPSVYQSVASYQKHFKTNMTSTNPLIDGPDYTYLDGRSTPLRKFQKLRAIRQRDNVIRAIQLTKEIEFAVQRHIDMNEAEKEEKREIIKSKLKAKEFEFEWEKKKSKGK